MDKDLKSTNCLECQALGLRARIKDRQVGVVCDACGWHNTLGELVDRIEELSTALRPFARTGAFVRTQATNSDTPPEAIALFSARFYNPETGEAGPVVINLTADVAIFAEEVLAEAFEFDALPDQETLQ